MNKIELLHGTDHIIEVPDITKGNPKNDYGKGFYCTRIPEMAKEWACKQNTNGFSNRYELDLTGLKILNLSDGTHTVLNWIAILLQHRTLSLDSEIAIDAKDYIIEHYSIDTSEYDVIIGYRADDSYFSFSSIYIISLILCISLKLFSTTKNQSKIFLNVYPKFYPKVH